MCDRLMEFEKTDSSKLTIEEFDTKHIDLEQEMDPPCYTEGLRKAKLAQVTDPNIHWHFYTLCGLY